jgi:hypothetical protein
MKCITVYHFLSIQLNPQKISDHYERSFVEVVPSTEGRKSMLKLAERMVMSYCSGVKHPMTQKQRGGNHGVSAITEIWYLIQTFSFSLSSSKQTLCHLLSVFFYF